MSTLIVGGQKSAYADLRIVVDTSQPMHEADTANLRGAAIELLARSLPTNSSGGLWAYSQLTQQLVAYGPTNELWHQLMTVHGRNLAAGNQQADPTTALTAATWDLEQTDRGYRDVVLFSNGRVDTGATTLEHNNVRTLLLNTWASKLKSSRIRLHVVSIAPSESSSKLSGSDENLREIERDFLRQLAQLGGGLYRQVTSLTQMQDTVMDIVRLMQIKPTTSADRNGRFKVTPGTRRLSLLWLRDQLSDSSAGRDPSAGRASITTPNGATLNRTTSVPNGRWVLARDFEMVSIDEPEVGWWKIDGVKPSQIGVFGDVEIRISGLDAPVIPTQESHAVITLFDEGELIDHKGFLDLLDVRAWLVDEKGPKPLPIERHGSMYKAFFVSVSDGSYDIRVEVRAPTFSREASVPFVVSNPLRVDIKQTDNEVNAWLTFNHAQVDYTTLKVSAKVRKPPAVGRIVPANKLPTGLYQIAIPEDLGVVELTFTVGGNYLNKEGFFVKTRRQTVTLPLTTVETMRFNAQGKRIDEPRLSDSFEEPILDPEVPGDSVVPSVVLNPKLTQQKALTASHESENGSGLPLVPLWFVGVISVLNLLLAGLLWWLNSPPKLSFELRTREEVTAS